MRAYRLHDASWSRIVTQRVRRPAAIGSRLASRRRPDETVHADGQMVLLACNHSEDPRTSRPIDRRELLDRIVEALSVPDVDGVIASADLLEELTVLNVLEHRYAICSTTAESRSNTATLTASHSPRVSAATVAASNYDGVQLTQRWHLGSHPTATQAWCVAADMAELAGYDLPTVLELVVQHGSGRSVFETSWTEWIEPMQATASAVSTGSGVWITLPAINGLAHIADTAAFPVLVRDTDVPVAPSAWAAFFATDLPLTIRGMIPGVSALFPLHGSVAEATSEIAAAVRNRLI